MISLILFLTALILGYILFPLGFLYAILTFRVSKSKYLFNLAFALDKLGNAVLGVVMNDVLKKKNGHKFGNYDETISYVLGRNKFTGTLTGFGRLIAWILNKIDPEHVEKAVKNEVPNKK